MLGILTVSPVMAKGESDNLKETRKLNIENTITITKQPNELSLNCVSDINSVLDCRNVCNSDMDKKLESTPIPISTPKPTVTPTTKPTKEPKKTISPTVEPTQHPTSKPTVKPTKTPTPTIEPTETPEPTIEPTEEPVKNTYNGNYSESDVDLLAHLIYAEADNEGAKCQYYVGSVVLNRLASGEWGDTLYSVIYARGQYACTWDGNIEKTPDDEAYEIARDLLENGSVLPSKVIYSAEFVQNNVYCKIKNMYFCYD